jgi:hypothetical protein
MDIFRQNAEPSSIPGRIEREYLFLFSLNAVRYDQDVVYKISSARLRGNRIWTAAADETHISVSMRWSLTRWSINCLTHASIFPATYIHIQAHHIALESGEAALISILNMNRDGVVYKAPMIASKKRACLRVQSVWFEIYVLEWQ